MTWRAARSRLAADLLMAYLGALVGIWLYVVFRQWCFPAPLSAPEKRHHHSATPPSPVALHGPDDPLVLPISGRSRGLKKSAALPGDYRKAVIMRPINVVIAPHMNAAMSLPVTFGSPTNS